MSSFYHKNAPCTIHLNIAICICNFEHLEVPNIAIYICKLEPQTPYFESSVGMY